MRLEDIIKTLATEAAISFPLRIVPLKNSCRLYHIPALAPKFDFEAELGFIGWFCPEAALTIVPNNVHEEDPAICSPAVLGFSHDETVWVVEVQSSDWPFDILAIPEDKKWVIESLTESRVRATKMGMWMTSLKERDKALYTSCSPSLRQVQRAPKRRV
ncbi:hypothetical protein BDW69DRAFT_97362 [Aspergillus filifer]